MFLKLDDEQIQQKMQFINNYLQSQNAADGSKLDANSNVTTKNIATLETEINKDINIQINRYLVKNKIAELYGVDLANEYIRQIENHEIYVHDETSLKPYCVSISMYPFLLRGLKDLGGDSLPPKHLSSFCGGFINLVFAIASQFAGAVATVEFLMYFDYFARKDYGDDYLNEKKTIIIASFQQVLYSLNQPAAARGYQSVFWNISIFDRCYFESMFEGFTFPDGTAPKWETIDKLQKFFMKWFNQEREIAILTYPVVTAACLTKTEGGLQDSDFEDFITEELSMGNSFFIFLGDSPYALSSCCRLKNDVSDQKEFSYTLGAGGVSTGSINVITMNINRLIQQEIDILETVEKIQKYQIAYRKIIEHYKENGLLPVYDAGFISLDKQFLTLGINGLVEAAEFKGLNITPNEDYMNFVENILKTISDANKIATKNTGYKFNTEFVPAENLGVKNSIWDRNDGLIVKRDCYNSYTYLVEDEKTTILDKFVLHGKRFMQYLDGGSAYHCNLGDYPTKGTFKKLLAVAAKEGCEYFCFNIAITMCNECGFINKQTHQFCTKCHSRNIIHATRIIGYLKPISNYSQARKVEHSYRYYSEGLSDNNISYKHMALFLPKCKTSL